MAQPPPADDDVAKLLPKANVPWGAIFIGLVLALAGGAAIWLYANLDQRGLSVRGEGHVVVTPKAGAWALLQDGTLVRITKASADKLALRTGPCLTIEGALLGRELEVETATCAGGEPVLRRVGERLQRLGLKYGYWPEGLEKKGDTLEPFLGTPEIVAAMVDPRLVDPQLLWVYAPLFPETVREARLEGLPPPVVIQVKRNDFFVRRFSRTELAEFLQRPSFVFGAASAKGGWLVRTVEIGAPELPPIERLLVSPEEEPWPRALVDNPVKVSRRTPSGAVEPPPR